MSEQIKPSNNWRAQSSEGIVAAGGPAAVEAGIRMLAEGGNAADAAVATILALNVTDHGECSIGGEVPLLIYDANRREVKALSGQGGAPRSAEAIAWYMANGIPHVYDMKIAPVPSVVDLCITTLQHYGTKTFAEVAAPAITLLEAGSEDWHPKLARTLHRLADTERHTTGTRNEKLQAACDRFYGRGLVTDIAEELESFYIEMGGFLRRPDLAAHRTRLEAPVMADYRGYTVCKCGPWTQGPVLCQALRLIEGFDMQTYGYLLPDMIHVAVEALKLAMADRDTYYGDPEYVNVPLERLLSEAYTLLRRPLIDLAQASQDVRPGDPYSMLPLLPGGVYRPSIGGTTTCVVADRWGNVVAATPSANVPKKPPSGASGVTFGNRLWSLNTTPGHPNCIAPGKRPRITLTPTIVLRQGAPALAISVAGGDLQDQVALNLIIDTIDSGMHPSEAVTAPRFATGHHQDSFNPDPQRECTFGQPVSLVVNDTIAQSVQDELSARGHDVRQTASPLGAPVMLEIAQGDRVLLAAGDPRAGRHVSGL